ncbi:hypothetical protein IFM89_028357 [Coptis chinensis]|uniref:Uncharacterized protein n=1 Tax=Coptis chinensis TaxID=261450 RepID=A0A835IYX5_9MAGN|nr:hypothetical protein IFM89_028357 [Coptis chinensis]
MTLDLDVKVISQETITPSSPTPNLLRNFNLSLADQYAPLTPITLILFYPASANNKDRVKSDERSHRLKRSLSESLTHFYPLGGKINNNEFIDCNDEGVNFFEARVNGRQLSQVLNHPIPEELDQLLHKINFYSLGPKALLSIQANIFDCGGMALGVCISHKAADASSFGLFLNNWAAITREDNNGIPQPILGQTSLFPPNKDVPSYVPAGVSPVQNVVSKTFVFNAGNIAALKAKTNYTRVEAVSALIWRCAMNALRTGPGSVKSASVTALVMNLRGKMVPALSNISFGNLITVSTVTSSSTTESTPELHCLVDELREAKLKVDVDYVRKLQVDDGLSVSWNSRTIYQRLMSTIESQSNMNIGDNVKEKVVEKWAQLPTFLIWMIMDRMMTILDNVRLASVCKNWRAASKNYCGKPRGIAPWLMHRSPKSTTCEFVNMSTKEKLILDLTDYHNGMQFLFSKQGWLLLRDSSDNSRSRLVITRFEFSIPSFHH